MVTRAERRRVAGITPTERKLQQSLPKDLRGSTPTEIALGRSLPEDLRNLTPLEVQTGQTIPSQIPKARTEPTFTKSDDIRKIRGEDGKITMIILPDGRVISGGGETTLLETAQAAFPTAQIVEGTDVAAQRQQQELGAELSATLGLPGDLSGVEASLISQNQALLAGAGKTIPPALGGLAGGYALAKIGAAAGVARGAAVGAGKGGVAGAVTAAVVLGIIGAASGFYSGYQSNIQTQTSDQIRTSTNDLLKGETELKKTLSATWAGGDKTLLADRFNFILNELERQEMQLLLDVRDGVNLLTQEDGTIQTEKYNTFNVITRPSLIDEMRAALNSPLPDNNKALGWLAASGELNSQQIIAQVLNTAPTSS